MGKMISETFRPGRIGIEVYEYQKYVLLLLTFGIL